MVKNTKDSGKIIAFMDTESSQVRMADVITVCLKTTCFMVKAKRSKQMIPDTGMLDTMVTINLA